MRLELMIPVVTCVRLPRTTVIMTYPDLTEITVKLQRLLRTGIPFALFVFIVMVGCDSDGTSGIVSPNTDSPALSKLSLGEAGAEIDPLFNPVDEDRIVPDLLGVVCGVVTPESGGTLMLSYSRLVIPSGAVTGNTLVGWAQLNQTPADLPGALPRTYVFAPHGLSFLVSCKAYISFFDAGLGLQNPHQVKLYYYNESTGKWEPQETRVNILTMQFIVTLNHFSRYAFGRAA
jgi:hypothetical protein